MENQKEEGEGGMLESRRETCDEAKSEIALFIESQKPSNFSLFSSFFSFKNKLKLKRKKESSVYHKFLNKGL